MPHICLVPSCTSVGKSEGDIKFYQIPKEKKLREKWLRAIKRSENELSKRPKVCSKHFVDSDYTVTKLNYSMSGEWKVLKPNAIPSKNLPEKSTFKIKISKKNNDQKIKIEEVKLEEENPETKVKMPKKQVEILPRPQNPI
ncbi:hypothetical protein NQ317_009569 [Molorchus minor]|uniref:THAP-type domain-containing protein n=1 Tax=Molorchus minor TaxID=1323400 RepID=A0ABQ9IY43_9CUCU|nr:hypothetical protein NQ317_009569 [Molorchus minor]